MKQLLVCGWLLVLLACQSAWAEPHVVLVTPRGETAMERVFKDELRRRVGAVRFTLIKPDVANAADMKALPERIRKEKPSLIYSWGTPTTVAIAGTHDAPHISDIPIVFAVVADPLRARLVKDLRKPGRNITGTSHLAPMAVQLSAMKEYKAFTRLGVVYNPKEANTRFMLEDLAAEAQKSGIELLVEPVGMTAAGDPDPATLQAKIQQVKARGAEWLYLGPDTFVGFTHRQLTTNASLAAGLAAFTANESAIRDANSLFGLFSPVENMARFVAFKASQVLMQEKPVAEVPIETLQRFSVLINLCVAKALKTYPPLGLLNYADVRLPVVEPAPEAGAGGAAASGPGKLAKGCTPIA
jgi:putative tryptophan/tyrosine transport system substrate-binding protein